MTLCHCHPVDMSGHSFNSVMYGRLIMISVISAFLYIYHCLSMYSTSFMSLNIVISILESTQKVPGYHIMVRFSGYNVILDD